ncbi:MAG: acyltransferase [Porphyromonas sp.]|nr:acyltransferase [Porphyromonas sp.]
MLPKDEFLKQSAIINSLRFPATLLVIASHCVITLRNTSIPLEFSSENIFLMLEHLCLSFGPTAVALFSLITGYFFFYKLQSFEASVYYGEVKKRISSLLVPYLLWNLIAFGALYAKNSIAQHYGVDFGYNADEQWLINNTPFWELISIRPIDYPLWYIRDIIYLVILSPLIYLLIRNRRVGIVALGLALLVSYYPALRLGHIPLFFAFGAYMGFHKESIIQHARRLRYPSYILGLGYPLLRVFFMSEPWASGVSMYLLFCVALACINLAIDLYEYKPSLSKMLAGLAPAVFFMYAAHCILLINLVRGTLYKLIPWNNTEEKILALLITIVVVPTITYYAYVACSKLFPRLAQILSGGRG